MPPADSVSPGIWGFISFAVLAVVLYLLMRNMNARMRRMSYRQQDAGRAPGEAQALEGETTPSQRNTPGTSEPGPPGASRDPAG